MRCRACNVALSDEESVRKDQYGYLDLCNHCYHAVDDAELESEPDDKLMPVLEEYDDGTEIFDTGFSQSNSTEGSDDDSYTNYE